MKKNLLIFLSFFLFNFIASCTYGGVGSVDDIDHDVGPRVESLGAIEQADHVVFDVEWEPGVILAQEEDVLNDVQDLMCQNGVYTIAADSPLLNGLEAGDLVVWPQLGIFRSEEHTSELQSRG